MDDGLYEGADPRVVEVLSDLHRLEDLAVDQHVAVFEMAQARLRGLLTEEGHLSDSGPPPADA
jgi:hypothetical protein